tara:strand:+ start:200 stop:400 length:201 start_codon:yes stop_codon:yes gene_type:complete
MNSKFEGPLVSAFEADTKGVVKQEFITYRKRDGQLIKETVCRKFQPNGTDYHDVSTVEPLVELKDA